MAENKVEKYFIEEYLDSLLNNSPVIKVDSKSKIVIFSDLHLGKRNRNDDFLLNSSMFMYLLENYYYPKGYTLILNGDVEELEKNPYNKVLDKWPDFYALIDKFIEGDRLYRIVGNHDSDLYKPESFEHNNMLEAVVLDFEGNSILVFHGHQASMSFVLTPKVIKYALRYVARPLGIKNITRSYDNPRIHKIEKLVHEYSRKRKIISIIGHTHRPLFESLSEVDLLRFKIEQLLRSYPDKKNEGRRHEIEEDIRKYKNELETIYAENHEYGFRSSLYNQELVIPSIFNSGNVIGKRGITGIEITGGNISLIHCFDRSRNIKNYSYIEERIKQIGDSSYYRTILKRDSLDYIFRRIKLLA